MRYNRKQENNFIFGIRAVIEAIDAGKEIDKLFVKRGLTGELANELMELLKKMSISYNTVPVQKLDNITRKNHQGVVAFISPVKFYDIEEITTRLFEEGKNPFILILDGVTDVRNFGAICRTAECSGVNAILVPEKGSAQINADAVKTSAGALLNIPICRTKNLHNSVKSLKDRGLQVFAATEKASENYYKNDYSNPLAIIMGAEDVGISNELIKISDNLIKIPILGKIESLNVSVAAAILMYEVVKQRMIK